jgi:hypothetical protein
MGVYFNENNIAAHNGTNFVIEKVTKKDENNNDYTISKFKYVDDVLHCKFNHEIPAKNFAGDGGECCGWNVTAAQYDGVTWGDILYLGLYLGKTPDYIYKNKSVDSLDVVEAYQEIIDYVGWIDSNITVIQHDEWTYSTSKQYDIIICDLWAMPSDITQDHKTKLLNNYTNNLKSGGKIIIPISGETLN